MKTLINTKIINPLTDSPLQVNFGFEKDKNGKFILDELKNLISIDYDLTTAVILRSFISSAYPIQAGAESKLKPPTITDSHHALRILDVLRPFKLLDYKLIGSQPKYIKLEDEDYKWLLEGMKERACSVFGILGEVYINAIENLQTTEEPKKKEEVENKPRLVKT